MFCPLCHQEYPDNARFCPYCGTAAAGLNPQHHLAAGTVLNGRYIVGTSLGEGGFGITYKGFDKLLQIDIAIKEYFPSGFANRSNTISNEVTPTLSTKGSYYNNGKERFLQEAQHLARFSRERSIVVVRDFFSENNTAYMVMEYIDGKTLFQCVREDGPFDAETLIRAFLPLMRSLEKMHSAGIIHRDISPDNVMMQPDGSLKLIDFGAARYLSGEETHTISVMLKPGYAPCEQYSRKGRQGAWTDVYALCATLYACILNRTPPDALDRMTSDDLKKPSELGVKLPPRAENVLLKGLAVQPQDRIQSMGELADELERAFQSSGRTAPYPLTGADKPPEWFTDGNNPEPNVTVEAKTDSAANIQPEMPAELPPSAQPPAVNTRPPKKPINVLLIGGLALAVIAIAAAAVIIFANLSSSPAPPDTPEQSSQTDDVTEPPATTTPYYFSETISITGFDDLYDIYNNMNRHFAAEILVHDCVLQSDSTAIPGYTLKYSGYGYSFPVELPYNADVTDALGKLCDLTLTINSNLREFTLVSVNETKGTYSVPEKNEILVIDNADSLESFANTEKEHVNQQIKLYNVYLYDSPTYDNMRSITIQGLSIGYVVYPGEDIDLSLYAGQHIDCTITVKDNQDNYGGQYATDVYWEVISIDAAYSK